MGNCAGVGRNTGYEEDNSKPEVKPGDDSDEAKMRKAQSSADLLERNDKADDSWISKSLRHNTFFVATGLTEEELFNRRGMQQVFGSSEEYREMVMRHSGAAPAVVGTPDGRSLDAGWIEGQGIRNGRAVVILFHANAATWLDMIMWAEFY